MMSVNAQKNGAYQRLRKLIRNFEEAAAGKPIGRAVERSIAYLDGRIHGELERHRRTGNALAVAKVSGTKEKLRMVLPAYALAGNFKPGSKSAPTKGGHFLKWSFFKGTPKSALARIQRIFKEEIKATLTA